jgi:glycosyltransferase involved in cell wall biosynthesis
MKIAIDISQIVYEGTGVANYTKELVRHLLMLDKGNEYLLFGASFGRQNILREYFKQVSNLNTKARAKFLPLPEKLVNTIWNTLHIVNIEKILGKIDIFHSSDWVQPPTQAKKITTVHDLVVYRFPDISHQYIVETQKKRLVWVKKECDKILADSLSTKQDLINILHFSAEKIDVVYPGINEIFKPATNEEKIRVKQRYNLLDNYILTVGTAEPRKNLSTAINAFGRFLKHPLISARMLPLQLVVVGRAGWGEKIKDTSYIKNLDFVKNEDLPGLYSGATCLLYPSLYEGFGLPVIEAMACGTAVITSDRGSLKETAKDAALLVDPQSIEEIVIKMTQLFIDDNLRFSLIEKGKENISRFTWDKAAKEVKAIYEKVITGR